MIRTTFNKLREVKDALPHGSSAVIAEELGIAADDVRDFFRGTAGPESGYHLEPGPDGGIVMLDNTRILEVALRLAWTKNNGI
ncbi:MAG: DNA-binding protein [Paludibacteraceae bacterium]|nr:DNA-binding protein [Paludibacteraceae bacterium]